MSVVVLINQIIDFTPHARDIFLATIQYRYHVSTDAMEVFYVCFSLISFSRCKNQRGFKSGNAFSEHFMYGAFHTLKMVVKGRAFEIFNFYHMVSPTSIKRI